MLMKEIVVGARLSHSKCDGVSQCDLMEDDNRLSSVIRDRVKLTYMIAQKEQFNLCSIERCHVNVNYSYILLIIVSDYTRCIKCINHTA